MNTSDENQRTLFTILIPDILTDLYEMKMLLKCSNVKLAESLEAIILGVEINCSSRIKKKPKKDVKQ